LIEFTSYGVDTGTQASAGRLLTIKLIMLRTRILLGIAFILIIVSVGSAQNDPLKPSVLTGDVTSVTDTKIVLNSKTGSIDVVLNSKTEFKRVPPENPTLKAAVESSVSEIGVGDKLMVTGILAADGKSVPARAVYVMTQSEISKKKAKDAEMWRTRGIAGKVATVNSQTGQVTVEIRGLMSSTTMVVTPKADAKILRYAPDSEKFNEAKPSTLAEIKAGDNIRALGDKNADNTALSAETVITGAFQTVAGTVVSTDTAANTVVIKSLTTNKDVTIDLSRASVMKRFPAEMAEKMAGGGIGGGGGGGVQVIRPAGGAQPQPVGGAQNRPLGQRPGGGGGIDEMLDRFPTITAADLKVGDMIAVSSSKGGDIDHIRAIKLLAGVEPFVKMAQMAQGANPGGRGGNAVNFNIPGLDGVSFP
jgi:ribosomal protein L24